MDFLNGNIRSLYFKYLAAAFGSALISSIYGAVDMAMVGQYQGPDGTAALAVVAPVWNVIYSLGLLMGIGGSVLFATLRGQAAGDAPATRKKHEDKHGQMAGDAPASRGSREYTRSNQVFTASLIGSILLSILTWVPLLVWDDPILTFFGADPTLLDLAKDYLFPIKFVFPIYLFNQFLAAYLRNDGNPALATKGILIGGVFNVFGDYFFVFTLDMGIQGAGVATALGAVISFVILMSHFFGKRNSIAIQMPTGLSDLTKLLGRITVIGFSAFFVDVAMGIVTILFNRQIITYLGTDALAVYGIIINISTFVQACAYSIGQAAQPIISMNFGAGKGTRIEQVLKYALGTALAFGIIWTLLALAVPNAFVYIFMSPTESVLAIAPAIIRSYGISFLILPINILATYYFQAILKPGASFVVSVARGAVISGGLILLLPRIAPNAIWFAMPITELVVLLYAGVMILLCTKEIRRKFPTENQDMPLASGEEITK